MSCFGLFLGGFVLISLPSVQKHSKCVCKWLVSCDGLVTCLKCLESNSTPSPPPVIFEYVKVMLPLICQIWFILFMCCACFRFSLVSCEVSSDIGPDRTQQNYQKCACYTEKHIKPRDWCIGALSIQQFLGNLCKRVFCFCFVADTFHLPWGNPRKPSWTEVFEDWVWTLLPLHEGIGSVF